MEIEQEKFYDNRYSDFGLYKVLSDIDYLETDSYLSAVTSVVRSGKPEEILEIVDVLSTFVCNEESPAISEKIIETTVEDLLPILRTRDSEKVRKLSLTEFKTVRENLERIKQGNLDSEIIDKIDGFCEEFFS